MLLPQPANTSCPSLITLSGTLHSSSNALAVLSRRWVFNGETDGVGLNPAASHRFSPAQVGVTAAVFSLWMPVGAALYPPTGRLPLADVEAEIAARAPPGCTAVVYERGV